MHRKPLKTYGKKITLNKPVFSNFTHKNYLDSSDSFSSLLKTNDGYDESIDDNPFESTFDKIAKNAKLPPVPPHYNLNNSIMYVSSSSSSSLSDENWIENIKKSRKIVSKKLNDKTRKKKNIEKLHMKKVQNDNRKRQNNLHDIDNDDDDDDVIKNYESSPPQRKTRRSIKKYDNFEINSNTDESDLNSSTTILSPSKTNELKSCCVELTQIKISQHDSNSDNNSQLSIIDNDSVYYNEQLSVNDNNTPITPINQQDNILSNIKDCRIILSRLDVNSIGPKKNSITPDSNIIISSTPFGRHINSLNLKSSFSPIRHERNDESSLVEINELSEICQTDNDITNKIELTDNMNDKSPKLTSSVNGKTIQIDSHSDLKSFDDSNTEFSHYSRVKSTKLLFETDDAINNVNDSTKDITIASSNCDESINPTNLTRTHPYTLSLSPDYNKSRSMFDEAKPEINNTDDNLICNQDYDNKSYDYDKSSIDISGMSISTDDNKEISKNMSADSNTSLINETVNSTNSNTNSNESTKVSNKDTSEESYHLVISNASSDDNDPKLNSIKKIHNNVDNLNVTKTNDKVYTANKTSPFVLLTRLNDPINITQKRDRYINWDRQLCRISQNIDDNLSTDILDQYNELPLIKLNTNKGNKSFEFTKNIASLDSSKFKTRSSIKNNNLTIAYDDTINNDEIKMLYLKPGKSWARSLSILNHINNNDDIELLSIGKGKKWRQSVRSVLDMQSHGVPQSCIKNNLNDNDERELSNGILRSSDVARISSSTVTGTESTSPSRFVRRVSIRVVPDNKYSTIEDSDIKDTSFLEVYGIATNKNRDTYEKKSSSIAPRDTFVYNLRCSNVDNANIPIEPVIAAKNVVLQRCNQTESIPFEECYPDAFLEHCRKIGEGVYGEVFLYENKNDKSVIKIIPIEGDKLVNGEIQKKYCEILSEIIIAKELHNLRYNDTYKTSGFVEVKNIRCLIGKYPAKFIELWKEYDEDKTSDNDCPSMFTDDQLYIALELCHGGDDLEAFIFHNATEAYVAFVQAALTLAVAEKSLDFEHRDLHWGNILISRTNETKMSYKLNNEEIIFPCKGLKVSIIDFTLSRMSYQGCCIFNDLALDTALFTAAGEYQFEIYRLMKAKVGNNWQLFEPYTNILWLHYTLDKMIMGVRYKKKTTKIHNKAILKLQELKEILLDYDSAYDFIMNCDRLTDLQHKKLSSI